MTFEQFALLWPMIAIPLVAASAVVLTRLLERHAERHHPAE
ncbi:MAG TPA: hypothetical protein VGV41_12055 [Pseudolabrys sp.]|jgi:hypothetical protein|nr:hypothetical protein [Pseudolabrys sp.]HEV2629371.1 hypothetical protein [Pseudolabrys sp.]